MTGNESEFIAEEFTRFSQVAHRDSGYQPYDWQIRTAQYVSATGRWPDRVVAPTGAGKTSVIDVHLFVQALIGLGTVTEAPRRLALIVNRRALVDSQYDYANQIVDNVVNLALDGDKGAQGFLRGWQLRSGSLSDDVTDSGVQVVNLRGGQSVKDPALSSWRQHPDKISILTFTPEMFGSRLLFRGYGVSRGARPIEAGLLAYDTVGIVDEAHLSQQLALTAQQVARIELAAETPLPVAPLQIVISTATPSHESTSTEPVSEIQVTEEDLVRSESLRRRLRTPKPLSILNLSAGLSEKIGISEFVAAAKSLQTVTHGTVGVVVNSVRAALEISEALRTDTPGGEVVTLVGPMRPFDKQRLQNQFAGLFTEGGNPNVDFVVGTQTLEVGLDIGFAGMITELAPGDAIAQRAGRVNRFAKYAEGPIVIAVPPREDLEQTSRATRKHGSIYSSDDLNASLGWLQTVASTFPEEGLTPWIAEQQGDVLPRTTMRRKVLQRLEWWDVENLTASREYSAAEERLAEAGPATLDVWLRDDLDDGTTAGVVVRSGLPESDGLACRLLELMPFFDEEVAQVPIRQLYAFASRSADAINLHTYDNVPEDGNSHHSDVPNQDRAFIIRAGEKPQLVTEATSIHEGDILVVSEHTHAFRSGVFSLTGRETLDDVMGSVLRHRSAGRQFGTSQVRREALGSAVPSQWVVRISAPSNYVTRSSNPDAINDSANTMGKLSRDDLWELANDLRLLQQTTQDLDGYDNRAAIEDQNGTSLDVFLNWILSHPLPPVTASSSDTDRGSDCPELSGSSLTELRQLAGGVTGWHEILRRIVTGGTAAIEYVGTDDPDDEYTILFTSAMSDGEDDLAQASTPSGTAVLLEDHERDVAQRAQEIAARVKLGDLGDVLRTVGMLHDEGKADKRFQRLLGYGRLPKEPWAKSKIRSQSFERAFRYREHLVGWRHEQRSAVEAWQQLADHHQEERELVTRLVGTTHGHGLATFPHGSSTLLPFVEPTNDALRLAAKELFDDGEWEAIIERTARRYGLWGVAYLEAIVRAADVQISEEGR